MCVQGWSEDCRLNRSLISCTSSRIHAPNRCHLCHSASLERTRRNPPRLLTSGGSFKRQLWRNKLHQKEQRDRRGNLQLAQHYPTHHSSFNFPPNRYFQRCSPRVSSAHWRSCPSRSPSAASQQHRQTPNSANFCRDLSSTRLENR